MQTYIALLRGINVGGRNKVSMAELKSLWQSLGAEQVQTYIQSGNLVFRHSLVREAELAGLLHGAIVEQLALQVPVIIRSLEDWQYCVTANPWPRAAKQDGGKVLVSFLSQKPLKENLLTLESSHGQDNIKVISREVYIHCPGGYAKTRFSNTYFEKKLGQSVTTRNWKTVLQLQKMLGDVGGNG